MGGIYYGIKTGLNEAFVIDERIKQKLIQEDPKSAELIKSFIAGRDIKRYAPLKGEKYLLYIPWHFPLHTDSSITGASKKAENAFKVNYPAIYNHLLHFKDKLIARNTVETEIRYEWYTLQRFGANCWTEFKNRKSCIPILHLADTLP